MIFTERPSPPAAALPPSAAEPAAGIASTPEEAPLMPAAPFPESTEHAVRLQAIEPEQCRWIIGDEEAGADVLMCGAPAERRKSFCAAHCARAYLKAPQDTDDEEKDATEQEEAEQDAIDEAEDNGLQGRADARSDPRAAEAGAGDDSRRLG